MEIAAGSLNMSWLRLTYHRRRTLFGEEAVMSSCVTFEFRQFLITIFSEEAAL